MSKVVSLAIETSTPLGSLALIGDSLIAEKVWDHQESHAGLVTEKLNELLKENNVSLDSISHIACGIGPGSFTGIRVGINFAKTLAYALDLPVFPLSSLELLALPALNEVDEVFCMQTGFRNLFYVGHYRKENNKIFSVIEPQAWTLDEFNGYRTKKILVLGEAYLRYEDRFSVDKMASFTRDPRFLDRPKASFFNCLDLNNYSSTDFSNWAETRPLYIRASEAEEKLRRG